MVEIVSRQDSWVSLFPGFVMRYFQILVKDCSFKLSCGFGLHLLLFFFFFNQMKIARFSNVSFISIYNIYIVLTVGLFNKLAMTVFYLY